MKHNLSIATALALSLLVAPACSKDKKGDKGETAEKASESKAKSGEKTSAEKKGSPGALAPADVLSHFPADTEIVISFNVAGLTGSSMWKQYGEAAMANASKELGEFKDTCGFDPITTLKSMHVGINSAKSDDPVLIVNGFARGTLMDCAKKMSEKEGEKVKITEDGKFTVLTGDDGTTAVAWINDTTLIVVPKKNDKAYLQARLDGKDGLKGNTAFTATAAKAKQGAPIWFAGNFAEGSPAASGMGAMGAAPKGFYGSIGFSDGIDFALGMSFADAAAAEQTLGMAKSMLPMAKGPLGPAGDILDKLQLATKDADMTIGLKLTDADVEKLKGAAGGILGGMGGF